MKDSARVEGLRAGVLTVSDRCFAGSSEDRSGPALQDALQGQGYRVVLCRVVPDDAGAIREALLAWTDEDRLDLILTSGGTGPGPRDITPEATREILEREMPGLPTAILVHSLALTPHAMLSRGIAGIRGRTLVVNLPGSPRAALECFEIIRPVLGHALEVLGGGGEAGHRFGGVGTSGVE